MKTEKDKGEVINSTDEFIQIYSEVTKKMKEGSCKLEECNVIEGYYE